MRKRLMLLSLLFIPLMVFGQWRVGIVGGQTVNFRSASTHYMEQWEIKPLAGNLLWNILGTIGVMGQYDFWQSTPTRKEQNWHLGVRTEINWLQKHFYLDRQFMYGHSLIDNGVKAQVGTDIYSNDYLTLPLMCSLNWGWPKYRIMINLGPYAGYWIKGKKEGNISLNGKNLKSDEDYSFNKERDQRWDFGIVAGIGLEWNFLQNYAVQAEARCYRSLQSVTKDYMATIKDPRYDTTLAFQLALLYYF